MQMFQVTENRTANISYPLSAAAVVFGLTGNRPQSAPACTLLRYLDFKKNNKMKKNLITILILSCALFSLGQTRNSIVDTSKLWKIDKFGIAMNPNPHFVRTGTEYVRFSDDTIIGSNYYKKIWKSDNNMSSWYVENFIREDSSKRVFINRGGIDQLIYDFNASVGANLVVGFGSHHIVLTNIDSIFIYNKYCKRYIFDTGETWLDNIGSSAGILYSGIIGSGSTLKTDLLCYFESDTLKYSHYGTCDISSNVGIKEINEANVSVTVIPNPVTSTSTIRLINSRSRRYNLEIFNSSGLKLKTFDIYFNNDIQINNSDYLSGIYFYKLIDSEKNISVGKFVVE